jgi:hypothetical protein
VNGERRSDNDIRGWLAVLVLLGGGLILFYGDDTLQLGVSNMMMAVIGFYYGSSQSNKENRNTIDSMVAANATAASALAAKVPTPPATVQPVEVVNREPVDVTVVKPP